jgi:signal peptidase II
MNKRDWLIFVILPFAITWGLDRITKIMSLGLIDPQAYGTLNFIIHRNYGAMLGLFSQLPPLLRVVSLSTGGAFLIFIFLILQFLMSEKMASLRMGMSILIGGILGNVADRIYWGYVVDFITFRTTKFSTPVFNVADALQWVGYILIIYALIKEGEKLWPKANLRKSYWVNPKFQIRYCVILLLFGVGFAIIAGTYSYAFLKVTIVDLVGNQILVEKKFLIPFLLTFLAVSATFIIILFYVGLVLSHRAAGPLYAFEKFLEDLMVGKNRSLHLRAGDEFTHLESLADKLTERFAIKPLPVSDSEATPPTEPQ